MRRRGGRRRSGGVESVRALAGDGGRGEGGGSESLLLLLLLVLGRSLLGLGRADPVVLAFRLGLLLLLLALLILLLPLLLFGLGLLLLLFLLLVLLLLLPVLLRGLARDGHALVGGVRASPDAAGAGVGDGFRVLRARGDLLGGGGVLAGADDRGLAQRERRQSEELDFHGAELRC